MIATLALLTWVSEDGPAAPVLATGLLGVLALELLAVRLSDDLVAVLQPAWWAVAILAGVGRRGGRARTRRGDGRRCGRVRRHPRERPCCSSSGPGRRPAGGWSRPCPPCHSHRGRLGDVGLRGRCHLGRGSSTGSLPGQRRTRSHWTSPPQHFPSLPWARSPLPPMSPWPYSQQACWPVSRPCPLAEGSWPATALTATGPRGGPAPAR